MYVIFKKDEKSEKCWYWRFEVDKKIVAQSCEGLDKKDVVRAIKAAKNRISDCAPDSLIKEKGDKSILKADYYFEGFQRSDQKWSWRLYRSHDNYIMAEGKEYESEEEIKYILGIIISKMGCDYTWENPDDEPASVPDTTPTKGIPGS